MGLSGTVSSLRTSRSAIFGIHVIHSNTHRTHGRKATARAPHAEVCAPIHFTSQPMTPDTPGRLGLNVTATGNVSFFPVEPGVTVIVYTCPPDELIVAVFPGPNAFTPIGTEVPGTIVSVTDCGAALPPTVHTRLVALNCATEARSCFSSTLMIPPVVSTFRKSLEGSLPAAGMIRQLKSAAPFAGIDEGNAVKKTSPVPCTPKTSTLVDVLFGTKTDTCLTDSFQLRPKEKIE